MARVLVPVLLAVLLAACGGAAPSSGGGAGATLAAPPAGGGDLPGLSSVIFGTGFDPASLAVTGKGASFAQGSPLVAVGRPLAPRAPADVMVQISSGSRRLPLRPVSASSNPDSAELFAADLSADALAPGTWIVAFTNPKGNILASGNVTITP
jgi:hypothetical protein